MKRKKPRTRKPRNRRYLLSVSIDRWGDWRVSGDYCDAFFTKSEDAPLDECLEQMLDKLHDIEEAGAAVRDLLNVSKIGR